MKQNKILALLAGISVMASSFGNIHVFAAETGKSDTTQDSAVEIVTDIDSLSDVEDNELCAADAIILDEEAILNEDAADIQEVLDNGTGIIIEGDNMDEICDAFDIEAGVEVENEKYLAGFYLKSDGGENYLDAITCQVFNEDGKEVSDKKLEKAIDEIEIPYDDLVDKKLDAIDEERDEFEEDTQEDKLAKLQSCSCLGASYTSTVNSCYLYILGNTISVYNGKIVDNRYHHVGNCEVLLSLTKYGTSGSTTEDYIHAHLSAQGNVNSPNNGTVKVKSFTGSLSTDATIEEYTGYSTTKDKKISISASYSGHPGASISYSWNPDGNTISPYRNGNTVSWTTSLAWGTQYMTTTKPTLLVKRACGTTQVSTAYAWMNSVVFRDFGSFCTNSATLVALRFKNHRAC